MDEPTLARLETLFLALADKTRLRLLALMAGGEVPVGFLADQLGESQPKVSRHLAYLRSAGLASTRRDGKRIYYGIDDEMDVSVKLVLNAALNSITANIDGRQFVEDAVTVRFRERHSAKGDTSLDAYMNDWKPNELEIFLL